MIRRQGSRGRFARAGWIATPVRRWKCASVPRETVTFVAEKAGFGNPRSAELTGEITVADIGCPRELIEAVAKRKRNDKAFRERQQGRRRCATRGRSSTSVRGPLQPRSVSTPAAHGITVHPRPDQRHIRPQDVFDIAELLKKYPKAEFNIEGNPFIEFMHFVEKVRPTQATLVPDDPAAATSDHGWDLQKDAERLAAVIRRLKEIGMRVSLFMDPQPEHMELAKRSAPIGSSCTRSRMPRAFAQGSSRGGCV